MSSLVGRRLFDARNPLEHSERFRDFRQRGSTVREAFLLIDHEVVPDPATAGAHVLDVAVRDHPPLADDDGARASLFDLVQVVRGEHNRSLLTDLTNVAKHLRLLVRIQVAGRFVQDEDWRIVDQRLAQADALAITVRQGADVLAEHTRQTAHLDDLFHALFEGRLVELSDIGDEFEVVQHAHVAVQRRALRQVTHTLTNRQRVVEHVVAMHAGRALGGRNETSQDAHSGRLAGTIWSQKANDFALAHLEANFVEGPRRAEALAQTLGLDHHVTRQGKLPPQRVAMVAPCGRRATATSREITNSE